MQYWGKSLQRSGTVLMLTRPFSSSWYRNRVVKSSSDAHVQYWGKSLVQCWCWLDHFPLVASVAYCCTMAQPTIWIMGLPSDSQNLSPSLFFSLSWSLLSLFSSLLSLSSSHSDPYPCPRYPHPRPPSHWGRLTSQGARALEWILALIILILVLIYPYPHPCSLIEEI